MRSSSRINEKKDCITRVTKDAKQICCVMELTWISSKRFTKRPRDLCMSTNDLRVAYGMIWSGPWPPSSSLTILFFPFEEKVNYSIHHLRAFFKSLWRVTIINAFMVQTKQFCVYVFIKDAKDLSQWVAWSNNTNSPVFIITKTSVYFCISLAFWIKFFPLTPLDYSYWFCV